MQPQGGGNGADMGVIMMIAGAVILIAGLLVSGIIYRKLGKKKKQLFGSQNGAAAGR